MMASKVFRQSGMIRPLTIQHNSALLVPGAANVSSTTAPLRTSQTRCRAALLTDRSNSDQDQLVGGDFYSILGISPRADAKTIKMAYYDVMRHAHPDQRSNSSMSSVDASDTAATDFCVLLNDIYETLTDPERRALYDDMAGFSETSINPFVDTSMERDQVFVDEATCIGCRNCKAVCPSTYIMEEENGRARVIQQGVDPAPKLQESIDTCPVSCIHYVTAAQLPVLEAAMQKMERSPVWALMSDCGRHEDVFSEASIFWEKRQSANREFVRAQEVAQAPRSSPGGINWANLWSNKSAPFEAASGAAGYKPRMKPGGARSGSGSGSGDDGSSSQQTGTKAVRDIAGLAAKAARTSRTWKQYQDIMRNTRNSKKRMLAEGVESVLQ